MKPTNRKLKSWRKESPAKHRSFGEKRNRCGRHIEQEMRELIRAERRYERED